ncbi:exonuclease subunit SbcD [Persicimonas caeni]|uniref:Nuclease SbcCD subunit D n=1 Tax=Persicimonas caeni TaxID=2292766 RepID=A0A4Y6PZJ1_PERCE|nr:exonuclease subunit SbcD [Persicimonas caeni]QDG53427.1 exonuclease subunit SbcD [Persicimonas caeni]QED34648.1 exonuclease subunit SbcD [Persicimonas caeni]
MRLLHTSDWHLGASIKQVDCHAEQDRFLSWLVDTLEERDIDVLVVAGDIFHYSNPSNAARKLFYNFLSRCARVDNLRKIIIVAGNHDSPSGLEAPRELLGHLDVHVVGALPRDEEEWPTCLVPVEGHDGEVELVVAAVPYVQEARLGVSLGDGGESELREEYQEAFARLYRRLADEAAERWPQAALAATGHLTIYGKDDEPEKGDFHTGIHRTAKPAASMGEMGEPISDEADHLRTIGTIEAMGPQIFDERFQYVALGHIHRPMPVGGTRHIRYCGTPVATSLDEDTPPRQVIQVDVQAGASPADLPIEVVQVPKWREIFEIDGSEAEINDMLAQMKSAAELPPVVFLRVQLGPDDVAGVDRLSRFKEIIDEHHEVGQRPVIVELRERYDVMVDGGEPIEKMPPIEELSYLDVFEAMYRRRHPDRGAPPERLVAKFRQIEQLMHSNEEGE